MAAIMTVSIYPYGNAQENQVNATWWEFQCQHGDEECAGNLIETCAMNLYPSTPKWLPFINCVEHGGDPVTFGQQCAQQTGLDLNKIQNCTGSIQGNMWEHTMGAATDVAQIQYTPWVTINGQHSTDAENNLQAAICAAWTGTPPAACSQIAREKRSNIKRRQTYPRMPRCLRDVKDDA